MEVKSVGVGSVFRFFGGMFGIIGLILGLLAGLQGPGGFLGNFPALKSQLEKGQAACFLVGIISGISFGIVMGIISAFFAGIEFLVKE